MRLISRIDIKNDYVVKGICFEGLRKIGNPETLCKKYYDQMSDELLISDVVAVKAEIIISFDKKNYRENF